MSYGLTWFIHPLEKAIKVSDYLKISFDNPRTEKEVALVKNYIESSYKAATSFKFPPSFENDEDNEKFVSLGGMIKQLISSYESDYANNLAEYHNIECVYELMARIWVIIRFDDEGSEKVLSEQFQLINKEDDRKHLVLLDDDHPLVKNEYLLENYSYLLSLLTNKKDDGYTGKSFVISGRNEIAEAFPNKHIPMYFLYQNLISSEHNVDMEKEPFHFSSTLERVLKLSKLIDKVIVSKEKEKIEYISYLLRTAGNEINDEKHQLVILVSIIELLLTHNPNFNRFNVEDSISKQFQLKASILIYENDKTKDVFSIQKRLKTIYSQRSNIAHGNFEEVNKYIKNLNKKDGEEEYFSDLISDLYSYISAILEEYIKNPSYINFLKQG
ncbi:HEPN domain-containing protein [Aliivibrio fischeri]|uniref:HEPN domain-containing protein n=1 Tax=Aliivibrio fischeri TaxID=668 RepID=UPI0012DA0912|nr:HEPN domain-containing protein [Aliivibrio fischeri]MUL11525.1 hypothetical protein [Aliivibrio fischeri]MUL15497.1 hypothetical protein [Aliivibrio fischeri]